MSLVLAIEPDRVQEDLLREVHSGLGVQLLVVSSKDDAIEAIEREVPDLILVNALLSPREEVDLVAHLRSLDNLAHLQLLTIPRLARAQAAPAAKKSSLFGFGKKRPASGPPDGCDPAAFAEQVTTYLARAHEVKTRPRRRVPPQPAAKVVPPPAPEFDLQTPVYEPPAVKAYEPVDAAPVYEPPAAAPVYEPPAAVPVYEPPAAAVQETSVPDPLSSLQGPGDALIQMPVGEALADVDSLLDRLGFGPDKSAVPNVEDVVVRVKEPQPEPATESEVLIDLDTPIEPANREWQAPESGFRTVDVAQIRAEAEATLATELERVQAEAAQQRERELAQWQAESEAMREATIGQARAEAEARAREALAEELARSRAESEQARNQEIARLQSAADERLEAVTREARQVAETEVARAFTEELARVRADSEVTAARALEQEVARVRGEADARLQAELERVRHEADQARRAEHAAVQAEAERIREAAAREARTIAEQAAARTLDAELQRVRAEADAVRAAAEARLAEQSKAQADASHAIAEAERVREAAAREAREIAEAAAAQKLEAELRRIRIEAEARMAKQSEAQVRAEKLRAAAAREAQAQAEAAASHKLEVEIQRVRVEADARLASELAHLRADAERRRAIELEEMKRQVEEMREAAAEQARTAAAEAVAAEVARASALRGASSPPPTPVSVVRVPAVKPTVAAAPAPEPVEDETEPVPASASYYDLWRSEGSPSLSAADPPPWARSLPSRFQEKRWMLPAAAGVLLVVCGSVGISVDTTAWAATAKKAFASAVSVASTKTEPPAAPVAAPSGDLLVETTPKGAQVRVDGTVRGKTPLTVKALTPGKHKVVLESGDGIVIRREVTIRAGERAVTSELMVSGWLTVVSRIPVEVHLAGRRIGASGDEQIVLSPGRHKIIFVNKRYNVRETRTVDVQAGSIASHTLKLPNGVLNVDAPAGAEVLVDGDRVGEAPLRGAAVAVGAREIVVRHPSFGERRQTVDVRQGVAVTLSISASDGNQPGQSFDGLKVLSESAANPANRRPRKP